MTKTIIEITKEEFLEGRDDGYEYNEKYYWSASDCLDQLLDDYEDGDLEDGLACVTICKFSKILTGYSIDTMLKDLDEYTAFTPDDYVGGSHGMIIDVLQGDYPELKQKYGELKKNWDEFLVMLDNLFPSLEPTKETINVRIGEPLNLN